MARLFTSLAFVIGAASAWHITTCGNTHGHEGPTQPSQPRLQTRWLYHESIRLAGSRRLTMRRVASRSAGDGIRLSSRLGSRGVWK